MFNSSSVRKLKKLIHDPNLFFYDMFRKKIGDRAQVAGNISGVMELVPVIDIEEFKFLGLSSYLKKNVGGVLGPKDGVDPNGLLVSSENLYWVLAIIFELSKQLNAVADIYTLGAGAYARIEAGQDVDQASIYLRFRSRSDFVCELTTGKNCYVCHLFLYDVKDDLAIVRSNNVWQKKFLLSSAQEYFELPVKGPSYDIDAVYTWVNHADVQWQESWNRVFQSEEFDPDRFTSNDELIYSLRSVQKYAPWMNRIHIVSNCSRPEWLIDHPKINWVSHEDIFPDSTDLPTFSSHAIEACLHRIPGLAEQFVYFNDDFILNQPCLPSDFFDATGRSISYFEPYGMVAIHEKSTADTPDYLQASRNASALIAASFQEYSAKNLHRHIPYALRRSVLEALESWAPEAFQITRSARRRTPTDVNVTSFLYHHYANAVGKAVGGDAAYLIVRPNNIHTLFGKDYYKYKFLCFNDGAGSSGDKLYKRACYELYLKRFGFQADWENKG